jgi:hypothetical protein
MSMIIKKKPNILILSHEDYHSPYGASSSLREHCKIINNYENNIKICIISSIYPRVLIKNILKKRKHKDESNLIYYSSLPWVRIIDYCEDDSILDLLKDIARKVVYSPLYLISIISIISIIIRNKIEVLHLNSPVLAGILPLIIPVLSFFKNKPISIVHMRDFLKSNLSAYQINALKKGDYFVAIDEAVKVNSLKSGVIDEKKIVIVENPFSTINEKEMSLLKYKFKSDKIYCAIVGNIIEEKGFKFVIESFLDVSSKKNILLIVGGGKGEYFDSIMDFIEKNTNIEYLGEVDNLMQTNFYLAVDYVIRGDVSYRTGRTVYESLYNSCNVILPGKRDDLLSDAQLVKFENTVIMYNSRDRSDLSRRLGSLKKVRKEKLQMDNHLEYYNNFIKIYHPHKNENDENFNCNCM